MYSDNDWVSKGTGGDTQKETAFYNKPVREVEPFFYFFFNSSYRDTCGVGVTEFVLFCTCVNGMVYDHLWTMFTALNHVRGTDSLERSSWCWAKTSGEAGEIPSESCCLK